VTIPALIEEILSGRMPESAHLEVALEEILSGTVEEARIAGLLVALRSRPPEGKVLAALARTLLRHALPVTCTARPVIDTCGTGGDGAGTFNVSTATALVVAACGGAVAKHGNRAVSSRTGSADVLEALGVRIDLSPEEATVLLDAAGFAFLFAPRFQPRLEAVGKIRRSLGIPTAMNLLGPLTNPARPPCRLVGVSDPRLTFVMAEALLELGVESAAVIHCQGLDEIGLHHVTRGHRIRDGRIVPYAVDPAQHGVGHRDRRVLAGGDAGTNAGIILTLLRGEQGPRTDIVLLNAAVACELAGLTGSVAEGLDLAMSRIADGTALRVLERVRETSERLTAAPRRPRAEGEEVR
jgi:anthranilate phosphoribosyltransferase